MIVVIVQLQGNTYFWCLADHKRTLAHSTNIDEKEVIEKEAEEVANELGLNLWQSERSDT